MLVGERIVQFPALTTTFSCCSLSLPGSPASLSLPPRSSQPTAALLLPPTIRQEEKESGIGPVYTKNNTSTF